MAARTAVITAAGLGSRLGRNMPKCLVEVQGTTILEHQLSLLHSVPEVRLVVGYQADRVKEVAKRHRRDIVFVENDDFRETTVLQSMYRGLAGHDGAFLSIEGDVLFDRNDFVDFLDHCSEPGLLALTPSTTDQPLYADVDRRTGWEQEGTAVEFRREPSAYFEWCGLSYLHSSWIVDQPTFTYECVAAQLPLSYRTVRCYEVDTPEDFARAESAMAAAGGY